MPGEIASRLRSARLGHALMEAVPGAAMEVGRVNGPAVVVGPVGYPGAEVLPCQHRGALAQGLAGGTMAGYVCALGLAGVGGALYLRLLLPPGADLGTGVIAVDDPPRDGWSWPPPCASNAPWTRPGRPGPCPSRRGAAARDAALQRDPCRPRGRGAA